MEEYNHKKHLLEDDFQSREVDWNSKHGNESMRSLGLPPITYDDFTCIKCGSDKVTSQQMNTGTSLQTESPQLLLTCNDCGNIWSVIIE